jgi:hypothetical protein
MPSSVTSTIDVLSIIRGTLKPARANARSVAELTTNPGCTRRRVIDAANVRGWELAQKLGYDLDYGQSPFAITAGNSFERRLKEGSHYALLVEALAQFVTLPNPPTVIDLGKAKGKRPGDAALRARAAATDKVLAMIARGDVDAPHIVDHPVLEFAVGGTSAFLEPDALAFRVGTKLELVEIKSYAIIDGQGAPGKLAATAGQAAVYLLALRATLSRLGFDPELLTPSVILVAPKNFGRAPTAHRVPLKKKMMALERVLRAIPSTGSVLDGLQLPKGFTLDVDPGGNSKVDASAKRALDHAVRCLPMLYVPECLAGCDMAKVCRDQAIVDDDPSRLGRAARDSLAGVARLADALRLATVGTTAGEAHLQDIADTLRVGYAALERARGRTPKAKSAAAPAPVVAAPPVSAKPRGKR